MTACDASGGTSGFLLIVERGLAAVSRILRMRLVGVPPNSKIGWSGERLVEKERPLGWDDVNGDWGRSNPGQRPIVGAELRYRADFDE